MTNAAFGTLNLHRMDCDRQHPYPCDPWQVRAPRFGPILQSGMRCSVYAWQECLPIQADDLSQFLGWGSAKNPPYVIDENYNAVAWDRDKWRDLETQAHSLTNTAGDVGDRNRRSVLWVLLEHLASKARIWFGSSHLESGDAAARLVEMRSLMSDLPSGEKAIGMDRNSFDTSDPAELLHAKLPSLQSTDDVWSNPTNERSFHGWQKPIMDGKCIDGIHASLPMVSGELVSTVGLKATDHSGLRVVLTVD